MIIHHLNCASFCPLNLAPLASQLHFLISGLGPLAQAKKISLPHQWSWVFPRDLAMKYIENINELIREELSLNFDLEKMVLDDLKDLKTHCLLLETDSGLILADTGLGIQQRKDYWKYPTLPILGFSKSQDECARMQIKNLGLNPNDVRHIFITHLDYDHAGGLSDFPKATVHLSSLEKNIAQHPQNALDKSRYIPHLWRSISNWETYDSNKGDKILSFNNCQQLKGVKEDIFIIPLHGHTCGHSGLYIREHNMLFAGDAYLNHLQVDKSPYTGIPVKLYNMLVNQMPDEYDSTLERIRESKNHDCNIFCSHDRTEFRKFL